MITVPFVKSGWERVVYKLKNTYIPARVSRTWYSDLLPDLSKTPDQICLRFT